MSDGTEGAVPGAQRGRTRSGLRTSKRSDRTQWTVAHKSEPQPASTIVWLGVAGTASILSAVAALNLSEANIESALAGLSRRSLLWRWHWLLLV